MTKSEREEWPWSEDLDAPIAAPNSHKIKIENDKVRTLEVSIPPGVKEPMHTHRLSSVMIVTSSAKIKYYDSNEEAKEYPRRDVDVDNPFIEGLEPEGLHAVENIDRVPYLALRIEIKD